MTATLDRPAPSGPTRRAATDGMVQRYADAIGVSLHPAAVRLDSGTLVTVDGMDADGTVFVEAHDLTEPGHRALVAVAQDVFKLSLVRSSHPHARAVVLVGSAGLRDVVRARVAGTPAADLVEIRVCP